MFSYPVQSNFDLQYAASSIQSSPTTSARLNQNDKQDEYTALVRHPITRFFFGAGRLFLVKPWKNMGWFVMQVVWKQDATGWSGSGNYVWRAIGYCDPLDDTDLITSIKPFPSNAWFDREYFTPGAIFNQTQNLNQWLCDMLRNKRKEGAKPFHKSAWKHFFALTTSQIRFGAHTLLISQPSLETLKNITEMSDAEIVSNFEMRTTDRETLQTLNRLVEVSEIRQNFEIPQYQFSHQPRQPLYPNVAPHLLPYGTYVNYEQTRTTVTDEVAAHYAHNM